MNVPVHNVPSHLHGLHIRAHRWACRSRQCARRCWTLDACASSCLGGCPHDGPSHRDASISHLSCCFVAKTMGSSQDQLRAFTSNLSVLPSFIVSPAIVSEHVKNERPNRVRFHHDTLGQTNSFSDFVPILKVKKNPYHILE